MKKGFPLPHTKTASLESISQPGLRHERTRSSLFTIPNAPPREEIRPSLRHAPTGMSAFSVMSNSSDSINSSDPTKAMINRMFYAKKPAKSMSTLACSSSAGDSTAQQEARMSVRCSPEERELLNQTGDCLISRIRGLLTRVILSHQFEMSAGCLILLNFIVICLETNASAAKAESDKGSAPYNYATAQLSMYDRINFAFLSLYSLECAIRLFIQGKAFFKHRWNVFDFIIVCVGIMGEVAETILGSASSADVEHFQVLRSIRMLRLLRAARVIISFKELYSLICGLSSCLKTLFWAAGLVFLLLTMWSILSVEYLHPLIRDLARDGHYDDCTYCAHAFKDIMNANLTLFQIISGDGWGQLSRPLIINHPWTAVVIVCIIFTMVFGMLNLITAVIVDTAAQARQLDVMHMAKHKEFERKEAWANFAELCLRLDENHDGEISLEELKKGIMEIPELNAHLQVMGVEDDDLEMVFDILDANHDGRITHKEFIQQLYKIQTYEVRFAHCFLKQYVEDIRKHVRLLWQKSSEDNSVCPSCSTTASFLNEAQPEPELAPPSPPQDLVQGYLPPADDDASPNLTKDTSLELISIVPSEQTDHFADDPAANLKLDSKVLQGGAAREFTAHKVCEGAEGVSILEIPGGCEHFSLSSPVHGGVVDEVSFENATAWITDASPTPHRPTPQEVEVRMHSFRNHLAMDSTPDKESKLKQTKRLTEGSYGSRTTNWQSDSNDKVIQLPGLLNSHCTEELKTPASGSLNAHLKEEHEGHGAHPALEVLV
eukprot:gnl/MRDRNA2_/MRDRNA2_98065_c0_seq1.p1 gnl/MRDRNA2_/MRDRNA2_98065_c0~~gnl/MRDRNA2_/MRDRNA2_98065_c0_seq1.p1  ORF type:complete len:775 (-),score=133.59 gnl/MRDRNA2_/MRDRNA2_98065_c0_seq1:128-2452(-)